MKRGVITSARADQDRDRVFVDVNVGVGRDHVDIPLKMPAKGVFYVPDEGDHVIVYDEGDGKRAAMHPEPGDTARPPLPDISSGELAISLAGGDAQLIIRDNGDIDIVASGDINIDGNNVVLGDEGAAVPLAPYSHTHPDPDTGDTGTPNEASLNTEAE